MLRRKNQPDVAVTRAVERYLRGIGDSTPRTSSIRHRRKLELGVKVRSVRALVT